MDIFSNTILPQITLQKPSVNRQKVEESAQDFEAFFLSRMLESMYEGVATEGFFGGGQAEKIYRSLLLDEYGKEMARLGGIGVKDYVMQAILDIQETMPKDKVEG